MSISMSFQQLVIAAVTQLAGRSGLQAQYPEFPCSASGVNVCTTHALKTIAKVIFCNNDSSHVYLCMNKTFIKSKQTIFPFLVHIVALSRIILVSAPHSPGPSCGACPTPGPQHGLGGGEAVTYHSTPSP